MANDNADSLGLIVQITTLEDLPTGTKLARIYPAGIPAEQCVKPLSYKFNTCILPPTFFQYGEEQYYICEIVGATNIKATLGDIKSLWKACVDRWPFVTHVWWNHKGKDVYFPRLK